MMGWRDSKSAASSIICWMGGGCEVRGGAAATGSIRSETSVGTFVALGAGGVEAAPEGTTLPVRPVGKVAEDRPSRATAAASATGSARVQVTAGYAHGAQLLRPRRRASPPWPVPWKLSEGQNIPVLAFCTLHPVSPNGPVYLVHGLRGKEAGGAVSPPV
eukprot:scaffold24748_cov103-Isochrysis_galbana.AAC.1